MFRTDTMEAKQHDVKLQMFISQTGADPKHAKEMLEGHQWNVDSAVKMYRFMQTSSLPPPGPKKNVEPKRVNVVNASIGGGVPATASNATRPLSQGAVNTVAPQPLVAPSSPNTLAKKLKRGLSKTSENIGLVNKARDVVLHDIVESTEDQHFIETPEFTFILPDLTVYSEDFRAFLHKDLIEMSTLVSLEQAGRLNWWADLGACQRLWPLATTGDGNCLLHAASLGMWGFHDRLLILRKALCTTLTNSPVKGALWRRWRWHQTQINKQSGLVYSETEWQTEWDNLLRLASTKPRTAPGSQASCCNSPSTKGLMERDADEDGEVFYESLEEFHVFVLAHVLRRPVVVVADTILKDSNGEALAPIPFGGIYLPIECEPKDCHRSPLLLTYDASHFSALVAMENDSSPEEKPAPPVAIPLVDPEFKLLPIHYLVDPGVSVVWGKDDVDAQKARNLEMAMEDKLNLLRCYMDIRRIPIPASQPTDHDTGSEPRSRASSFGTASVESDDSGGRDKDKGKVAKQMQTVAKSFGSIGKSMGKKLKKNFGGIGKAMKNAEEKRQRKPSVGSVTQSSKVSSLTMEMLRDRDHILCSGLAHKRVSYQEEMVKNYLMAAQERFKQDREFRQQQGVEMRQKAELKRQEALVTSPTSQCINPGCNAVGSSSTSYLCQQCYHKQKEEAISLEKGGVAVSQQGSVRASAPPVMTGKNLAGIERQDTVVSSGKSKFYTFSDEQHTAPSKKAETGNSGNLNNARAAPQMQQYMAPMELAKAKFYVNTDEKTAGGTTTKPPPAPKNNLPPGTAYIVNNLQNSNRSSAPVHGYDYNSHPGRPPPPSYPGRPQTEEPPLRPEFEQMYRQQTLKIKDDEIDGALKNHCKVSSDNGTTNSKYPAEQARCLEKGCEFYGSSNTDNLCSGCFKKKRHTLAYIAGTGSTQTKM